MRIYIVAILLLLNILHNPLQSTVKTHQSDEAMVVELFSRLRSEPLSAIFIPPEGWSVADPQHLPKSVSLMVMGKGKQEFPPSINLAKEPYKGTVQDYIKLVKEINKSQGSVFKSLGTIETASGKASFGQVDATNEWGEIRMMHVFFLKEDMMHILTAASTKEEFSQFRPLFFKAIRSLQVNGNVFTMISDNDKQKKLEMLCNQLKQNWKEQNVSKVKSIEELYTHPLWKNFIETVDREFAVMGKYWKETLCNSMQKEILTYTPVKKTENNSVSEPSLSMNSK